MKSLGRFGSFWLRTAVVIGGSALLFAIIAAAFWYEDLRYSLPTPRPAALYQPPLGSEIPVQKWLAEAGLQASGRPVLVHFLNPDCPCSRFNLEHLRKLHAQFGDRVFFVAAVQSNHSKGDLDAAIKKLDLGMPLFLDRGGRRAAEAGVYSTPQAVVVGADGRLAYRGNYNTSRYCTDPRTEFVRIALERLVGDHAAPPPPNMPAYGCQLPSTDPRMASQSN